MNGAVTERRHGAARSAKTGALLVGGVLVAMIVMAVFVNSLKPSWFIYVMGAVIVSPVLLSAPHPRRLLLGLLIACTQVNANVYMLQLDESTSVGTSGPGGLRFPLCSLVAILLLLVEFVRWDSDAPRVIIPETFKRPLLYFLGAILLSGLATPERMRLIFYVHQQVLSMIVIVAVANAIRDERDVGLAVNVFVISAAVQTLAFFTETATGITLNPEGHAAAFNGPKDHGGTFFSHSNGLAGYLLPLVLLAMTQFLRKQGESARRLSGLALAVGAAGLIGTMARAAWIGCAMGAVFILYVGTQRKLIPATRIGIVGMGTLLVAAMFATSLADRISADHGRDLEERKALMKMAWNVYVAHPAIGCGAGAYSEVFKSYLSNDQLNQWLYVVHNRFLLTAAEMGTVGIVAFLSLIVAWFRAGWELLAGRSERTRLLGLGICGGVVGLTWHMYWEPLTGFPIDGLIYALMGLAAGALRVERQGAQVPAAAPTASPVGRRVWAESVPEWGRSGG